MLIPPASAPLTRPVSRVTRSLSLQIFGSGLVIAAILLGTPAPGFAASPPQTGASAEAQGHTDRVAYEAWVESLNPGQRKGVLFWAAERSKPKPASCISTPANQDYVSGCQEAQRRLAGSDTRRRSEPDYRKGWNAPVTELTVIAAVNAPSFSASARSLRIFGLNNKIVSGAIGLNVPQIVYAFPKADCSGDLCEFARGMSPQIYCPSAGPCSQLVLFIGGMIIEGYSADLDVLDWSRSLEASIKVLGPPRKDVRGPTEHMKIRDEYWSWPVGDGLTLTYTATSGIDFYGTPLDAHNVMLAADRH